VDNKKKKQKIMKKKNAKEGNIPTTTRHVESDKPISRNHAGSVDGVVTSKNRKPKFPCRIFKGDRDCPDIPKVIEVWSQVSSQSTSLATAIHAGENPSTSNQVLSKKGKVKFPCLLCKEMHCT